MKIGIVYYSRTGNTRQMAKTLEEKFKEANAEVDLIEIEHEKKPGFLKAGKSAMRQLEMPIKNTDFDMKQFDFLIAGSPTWGGNPSPYIKSFIDKAKNIKGKKVAIFGTGMSPIDKRDKFNEIIKNNFEKSGTKITDNYLAFQFKRGKLVDGEQNIDNFVTTILKNKK